MAKLAGVQFTGEAVPTDSADSYAIVDAKYVRGGYKSVAVYADMLNITADRRTEGMLIYVIGSVEDPREGFFMWLEGNWKSVSLGADGSVTTTVFEEFKTKQEETNNDLTGRVAEIEKGIQDGTIGAGGGGDGTFPENSIVLTTLGGLEKGTDISGLSTLDVLKKIMFPYQNPGFTAFSTNIPTTYNLGDTTPGSLTLTWNTSNQNNIAENSIDCTVNGVKVNQTPLPNSGTQQFTITPMSSNTQTSKTIRITLRNTKGGTAQKDITLNWVNRFFYGTSTQEGLDANAVQALTAKQGNGLPGSLTFAAGGYKFIAFPSTWGEYRTIKDASNGLNVAMTKLANVTIQNANGVTQEYILYRTINSIGGSLTMNIAK